MSRSPQEPAPRVLYLTHRVPYPPDKGDRIRTYHLLRQMVKRGRVWLGCLADEPVPPESLAALNELCERVAVVPVGGSSRWGRAAWSLATGMSLSEGLFASNGLARVLKEWAAEAKFDAVVASSSALVPYLRAPALAGTPAVVDLIDVDSQKWLDFAAASRAPKKWLYRLEAARVRKIERALAGSVRAASVVSRAEADVYDSFTRAGAATVATNGVDLDYFAPVAPVTGETQLACAFVGALDYMPNEDAAIWFARDIWPAIRAKFPAAEFRIIGRKPTPAVQALAVLPGIRLIGQVPDVRPFVASAAVVVVPLRLARGVQNKVLEAMAMAKAVVAAPPALAALGTESGIHLLSASTPEEWVNTVSALFTDAGLRHKLSGAARQFVERHHHWEQCLRPLLDAIFPNPVLHT
ncbi:TIGR03087 family PEP-CTERM/XrtA system glycosyltransferase [Gemmata sp. G18]|uniref:TIGR03087 family PEP-CTERM/XrtA system glycosyltransferase n=1 Tax=Gemmata palustris TaxID=2822762 RepID=A0ABS5C026_9BACT|nr:TIGR03087 family PEP-CTERM/XrtA system glycosyltransferase [Gemmata palustris]MBP3959235.1 TIGR03087 family PEP-CTERM/XrtA system glycosyltransferase [Gemmata palustris]